MFVCIAQASTRPWSRPSLQCRSQSARASLRRRRPAEGKPAASNVPRITPLCAISAVPGKGGHEQHQCEVSLAAGSPIQLISHRVSSRDMMAGRRIRTPTRATRPGRSHVEKMGLEDLIILHQSRGRRGAELERHEHDLCARRHRAFRSHSCTCLRRKGTLCHCFTSFYFT